MNSFTLCCQIVKEVNINHSIVAGETYDASWEEQTVVSLCWVNTVSSILGAIWFL
jgi:hypothetical protein